MSNKNVAGCKIEYIKEVDCMLAIDTCLRYLRAHALKDIEAGAELYVDYGSSWFMSREGHFQLVPLKSSYEKALAFLQQYGKMIVGKVQMIW
ncbi:hypothetical protein QTG54_006191 [Skeletonema marinoi]|uniref:SET domain-containing protein n=1 Tax=Skeletonema marinoi TaxID=267567 RepID=A0AAD8YEL9_9STRA|nr:hypothetical protein QTG54_006191 [Skeletonema marinoi]